MKKIMILIFFTFFALDVSAQFRPSESQYFDVNNIFKNIGFEQGFSGWDITTTCTKAGMQIISTKTLTPTAYFYYRAN